MARVAYPYAVKFLRRTWNTHLRKHKFEKLIKLSEGDNFVIHAVIDGFDSRKNRVPKLFQSSCHFKLSFVIRSSCLFYYRKGLLRKLNAAKKIIKPTAQFPCCNVFNKFAFKCFKRLDYLSSWAVYFFKLFFAEITCNSKITEPHITLNAPTYAIVFQIWYLDIQHWKKRRFYVFQNIVRGILSWKQALEKRVHIPHQRWWRNAVTAVWKIWYLISVKRTLKNGSTIFKVSCKQSYVTEFIAFFSDKFPYLPTDKFTFFVNIRCWYNRNIFALSNVWLFAGVVNLFAHIFKFRGSKWAVTTLYRVDLVIMISGNICYLLQRFKSISKRVICISSNAFIVDT